MTTSYTSTLLPFMSLWRQLRWQIVLTLMLLTGLSLVSLLAITWWQWRTQTIAQTINHLETVVRLKQAQIDHWLQSNQANLDLMLADSAIEGQLNALASGQEREEFPGEVNQRLRNAVAVLPSIEELFVYDTAGQVVAASSPGRMGENMAELPFFEASLQHGGVHPPHQQTPTGQLMLLLTRPLQNQAGQVTGVLVARLDTIALGQLISQQTGLGERGEVYLVAQGSTPFITPVRFEVSDSIAVTSQALEAVWSQENGSGLYANYGDAAVSVIGVYRWLPEWQAGLVAEMETSAALAGYAAAHSTSLLAGLAMEVMVIGVGIYAATRLAQPVSKLAEVGTQLAKGDFGRRVDLTDPLEVQQLAWVLNQLAARRQQLAAAIDHANDAIHLTDSSGRSIYHNKAFADLLEYVPAELNAAGGSPKLFANPKVAHEVSETVKQGQLWRGETELCTRSGRIVPVNFQTRTVTDDTGQTIGVVGVITDITVQKQTEAFLAHERALLRTLIDNLPWHIYVKNRDGRYVMANRKMLDYLNLNTEEELIGRTDFDLFSEEMANRYHMIEQVILETGQPEIDVEEIYIDEHGQERWFAGTKLPLRGSTNNIVGLVGMNYDITDRKQEESQFYEGFELVERAKQEWESTADSLPQLICLLDDQGRVLRANRTLEQWELARVKEVKGRELHPLLHPGCSDPTCYLHTFWAHSREKLLNHQFIEFETEDTVLSRFFQIQLRPISGHTSYMQGVGVTSFAVIIFQDITERKLVENELEQYHHHLEAMVAARTAELNAYRETLEELVYARTVDLKTALDQAAQARDEIDAILNSAVDGLIVTDLSGKITQINVAAEILLGVRREEVINRKLKVAIKDHKLRQLIQQTLKLYPGEREVDIERSDPLKPYQSVLRARTTLVKNQEGRPSGTVTTLRDVTDERTVDRLKTEFLSTAAHELRTPLTSVQDFSEILLTRRLDQPRQERYVQLINQQATRMTQIVEMLLDVSRLETGRGLTLKQQPAQVADLLENVLLPFYDTATKHQFQIEGVVDLPPVYCDSFRVEQVLYNLLLNAVKYSPAGGTVTVRGRLLDKQTIEISVQDEGIGLTPEQLSHLFEKFYRADPANTSIGGAGLGLFICKLIVEAHTGKIWVESEAGVGTTVYFTLPPFLAPAAGEKL